MESLKVRRRVGRQILMLVAAVLFVLTALDITWLHRFSSPPPVDEDTGALTSRGLSQQRSNYLWGSVLLVTGAGLAVVGLIGLVRRSPVVELDGEGIKLRIDGPSGFVAIPWAEVDWMHSGSEGEDELVPSRVLLVRVEEPGRYPQQLWGAEWDGGTLMVDAESWSLPAEEVVAHARLTRDAWQRLQDRSSRSAESPGNAEGSVS